MSRVPIIAWLLLFFLLGFGIWLLGSIGAFAKEWVLSGLLEVTELEDTTFGADLYNSSINELWHPPRDTEISDLDTVLHGEGVYGFIFNDSAAPAENDYYGGYNYCNMPHVKRESYVKASEAYTLEYVEVIHRHHKRTPYAANTFPNETSTWDCNDEGLFFYGKPLNPPGHDAASTYWSVYTNPSNPFAPTGFNGTCQFPQITRGGLDDSWQHGKDLYEVYHDLLESLPDEPGDEAAYRVTNNVITSEVASMLIGAMYPRTSDFALLIQPFSVDSLEPSYPCAGGAALFSTYGVGSSSPNWTAHLTASQPLFNDLDNISGVSPSDPGFHKSWDHYFDNLSSRLCHGKRLPCNITNPADCITQAQANQVFRLGLYEYAYIYRSTPASLHASVASYGVYIAELAQNIRDRIAGTSPVRYRHNVAHDGSLAMLLSILQVDEMVWPGLGAEVVFEIFKDGEGKRFVRVLWGGQMLRSSYLKLGKVDLLPVDTLLEYFDELVGVGAWKVPLLCRQMPHATFDGGGVDFCVDCDAEDSP